MGSHILGVNPAPSSRSAGGGAFGRRQYGKGGVPPQVESKANPRSSHLSLLLQNSDIPWTQSGPDVEHAWPSVAPVLHF